MVAADMKKAGITMSREAMNAKRDDLCLSVRNGHLALARERVGTTEKDGYARLNYYKTNPGMAAEWARMESTGWGSRSPKPWLRRSAQAGGLRLAMPAGTSLPYNAMTVDVFPVGPR